MKKHLFNLLFLTLGIAILWSCEEKDGNSPRRSQQEIDDVVAVLAEELVSVEVQDGDENRAFGFRVITDSSVEINREPSKDELDRKKHEAHVAQSKLVKCVQDLDLTTDEMREIRVLYAAVIECRIDAFLSLREEMVEIILAMENRRLVLLEKLLKEEINRDQFRQGLKDIRERYQNQIQQIRQSHVEKIKPCLREMVTELRNILGEEKWRQFHACIKN